ncbi:MAG TPA: glycogen/starch/alpha-glucan phosphorylase, partial [Thermodesulfobacteriota bacterium]|nr:glycogen/starch/alpha-glucan phosphorylase [Thermodesulfobacteriota bacterium]
SNPGLASLISRHIGDDWVKNFDQLRRLEPFSEDALFRQEWQEVKLRNKQALARVILERTGVNVQAESLFDIQVKRLHEYKRQHLNVLHIITLYNRLRRHPGLDLTPRTFIFGGKAAPGYAMAKLIIKLINAVAEVVNHDPVVGGRLRVVFLPNFNVKNAQKIYPAADLSEQISTAGLEASGTGNMKFSINGALTIGTLDGANIEIREEVGAENFFLFGLTADQVLEMKKSGYRPRDYYLADAELKEVLDLIAGDTFSPDSPGLFRPLVEGLWNHDEFMLLADYRSYQDCQEKVSQAYKDQETWIRKSILNVARMGYFSSDRSIREYCERVWGTTPVTIAPSEFEK